MSKTRGMVAGLVLLVLAVAVNGWLAVEDHGSLTSLVHLESVQRVHTIGERCEATAHQAEVLHHNLPVVRQPEAAWFDLSYRSCLRSLAKVEARAHVVYQP